LSGIALLFLEGGTGLPPVRVVLSVVLAAVVLAAFVLVGAAFIVLADAGALLLVTEGRAKTAFFAVFETAAEALFLRVFWDTTFARNRHAPVS
jgi:hypothetical protein